MNALGIPHWKFKFGSLSLTVYRNERVPNTAHYHTLNARFSIFFFFNFFFLSIAPALITANNSQPLCGRQTERLLRYFKALVVPQVRHGRTEGFRPPKTVSCWCLMDLSDLMDFLLSCIVCPTTDNRKLRRQPCTVRRYDQHTLINNNF